MKGYFHRSAINSIVERIKRIEVGDQKKFLCERYKDYSPTLERQGHDKSI